MTAQEIFETAVRALSAAERLRPAKLILDELSDSEAAHRELGKAWAPDTRRVTWPNERLLQLAQTHRPPQSWWDETADPFRAD